VRHPLGREQAFSRQGASIRRRACADRVSRLPWSPVLTMRLEKRKTIDDERAACRASPAPGCFGGRRVLCGRRPWFRRGGEDTRHVRVSLHGLVRGQLARLDVRARMGDRAGVGIERPSDRLPGSCRRPHVRFGQRGRRCCDRRERDDDPPSILVHHEPDDQRGGKLRLGGAGILALAQLRFRPDHAEHRRGLRRGQLDHVVDGRRHHRGSVDSAGL
jgi:hypothetical protein